MSYASSQSVKILVSDLWLFKYLILVDSAKVGHDLSSNILGLWSA